MPIAACVRRGARVSRRSRLEQVATLAVVFVLVAVAIPGGATEKPRSKQSGAGEQSSVPAVAAPAFDFEDVVKRARKLAAKPYRDPKGKIPDWLLHISYDQWRDIRFRPDHSLWADGPSQFQVQFFHPGFYNDRT